MGGDLGQKTATTVTTTTITTITKIQASYSLALSGAALVSSIAASAGIPTYLTNIITLEPLYAACGVP